jgi:transposase
MAEAAQKLPSDPKKLRAIIAQMTTRQAELEATLCARDEAIEKRDRKIELLLERLELLRHQRFGPKADRISRDQLALFDEAELNVLIEELDAQIAEAKAPPRSERTEPKQTPKRKPLPGHLPRVERILDLPEEEQAAIAATHVHIGFDESEQLGVLPKQYYVIRIKRAKYAPIHADVPGAEAGLRIAPRPAQILPKAIAHSSLLAEVVTGKFVDGLPLYRQEKIFAREGIELSRQTLSGWIVQLATPLAPVMAALKQHLTQGPVLQIDETPVQVLDEPGRANTTKSYMWVYRGGPPGKPAIWFQYAPSRSGDVPIEFLFPDGSGPPSEHRFYLQTDGYAGYHALAEKDGIRGHMGCWAHVRRKAVEAANSRTKTGAAHAFVALIGKLYDVERRIRGTSPEHRRACGLKSRSRSWTRSRPGSTTRSARYCPRACSARRSSTPASNGQPWSRSCRTGTSRSTTIWPRTRSGRSPSGARPGCSVAVRAVLRPVQCSIRWWRPQRPTAWNRAPICITCSRPCRR